MAIEGTRLSFEFKDSLKFLLKSIDKSAKVLYEKDKAGIKNLKNLTNYFKDVSKDILELLVQKGVFPYTHLDSFSKLGSIEYPDYETFYDNLKDRTLRSKNMKEERSYGITLNVRTLENIWKAMVFNADGLISSGIRDFVLDVKGGYLHPGATLRAYPKHGGDNQLFEIVTLKR